MKRETRNLPSAIRMAVALGSATLAASSRCASAQTANEQEQSQTLEAIVVTGSNVRRVDKETANPLITIDRGAIEQSGKLTLGDLLQDLPGITGPVTCPRVNNFGGTGASTAVLRGLGSARTLLLVNGHRYLYGDINAIPAAAVERIEVLTDGASPIYGSDAVGGVVNFILRSNYQGAEIAFDYGISDRDDGRREGYHLVFGQTTDRGSILAGIDYNKFDSVLAANREFSKHAVSFYYGFAATGGSDYTPGGHIELPASLQDHFGCGVVTLKSLGKIGDPPQLSDFRCFQSNDAYNYQAHTLDLTPQERGSAFAVGHYKLAESVETYLEFFHNKTQAASQLAPQPLNPPVVSKDSFYNPFGADLSTFLTEFMTRAVGIGNRIDSNSTLADQATAGLRGTFDSADWRWNAYFNYGHFKQLRHSSNYSNTADLAAAVGPSYRDASGKIVCGTNPAAGGSGPVTGCTPVDIFNMLDPATVAALSAVVGNSFTNLVYAERSVVVEINGPAGALPAGPVQLAAGSDFRTQAGRTTPDPTAIPGSDGSCEAGSGCISPTSGSYDLKEAYAELLLPLLKDNAFAASLNLTVGDRYSNYSIFGGTNNTKFALEYRPIDDLLLRGTVAQVFRAPTIDDLYQGPASGSGFAVDPCFGLVGANAACVGVPGDGSFQPLVLGQAYRITSIFLGAIPAGTPIGPEFGKSFDWGFVYDPQWIQGLSVSADLWRVYLHNTIGSISAQHVLDLCYQANGGPYCHLIRRYPVGAEQGQIASVGQPAGNLGRYDVKGADLAMHYRLGENAFGNFAVNLLASYLDRYALDPAPGQPGDFVQEYAGHYTESLAIAGANFPRWKGLTTVNWNRGPWNAAWTIKYVGKYTVGYADLDYHESADAGLPGVELKYGASTYHNLSASYDIEQLHARVDIGIDNLTDKMPALLYANNTANGNVDVATFDTIGRFYWARLTVKF